MSFHLATGISLLPGVGEQRAGRLRKLGIETVGDLLFTFPRRYLDLRNVRNIAQLSPGETATIRVRVLARELKRVRPRLSYLKVAVGDDTGFLFLVFFNQPYLERTFVPGEQFLVTGRIEVFRREVQMGNPHWEPAKSRRQDLLLPIYPLTSGLSQGWMRRLVRTVLTDLAEYPPEILPFCRRQEMRLPNMRFALRGIHFPRSDMELEKARNYLIFDEFLKLQLRVLDRKRTESVRVAGEMGGEVLSGDSIGEFEKQLPFSLTKGQKKVMEEILSDLRQGVSMNRLVQGEVGSGKTVVGIFALWLVGRLGGQAALLAPTEILAEQHFLNWQEFLAGQDMPAGLLLAQIPQREKESLTASVASGHTRVVIGTHALLSQKVAFRDLRMVVVDEQHKFGVEQRELIRSKGNRPHYLIMSATPIPRSIALTFYGSLDLSSIGELPVRERRVVTYLFAGSEKEKILRFLSLQSESGRQGFIVTPSISASEDIESAEREYELIRARLPEVPCGLVHGRLAFREKQDVMRRFRNREILVLVATSVIESGIDVPEASWVVIEQAERFGLAQLHQLRGRVGRSGELGYCFLTCHSDDETVLRRLETFVQTESGMEIAEEDLRLRGPGDLLGTRQHGIPALRIGNIVSDLRILDTARKEVERIFREDPGLRRPEHGTIRAWVEKARKHVS